MDELIERIPSIAQLVFKELDNESLTKCKEISPIWKNSVDNQKEIWIRRIRLRSEKFKEFRNLWNSVISKTSVERVKDLGLAVQKAFEGLEAFEEFNLSGQSFSPHHVVAAVGSKELYEFIANKTGQIDNKTTEYGSTALHFSAFYGNVRVSKFIIENSDDKNPRSINDMTPLHRAAAQRNNETKLERLEICKIILAHLTDKNPRTKIGNTVLHYAADGNNCDIGKLIMDNITEKNPQNRNGNTPLHIAARNGNVEFCKIILDNVIDKNPMNDLGNTPLHEAASKGYLDVCKLIVPQVDEKNPSNHFGKTPLHYAAKKGCFDIIDYMKDFVVDMHPLDNDGKTPQDYAKQFWVNLWKKPNPRKKWWKR